MKTVLVYLPGLLLVTAGALSIVSLGSLPYIGWVYQVAGFVLIIIGILWLLRARGVTAPKVGERGARRTPEALFTLVLALSTNMLLLLSRVAYAASQGMTPTTWCWTMYQRVLYAEYAITALLLLAGFIGLLPSLLPNNPLAQLLEPFRFAGQMLVPFIIAYFLLLFPLDPMFVVSEKNKCYININNLKTAGPPLLRIILSLLTPPAPP